MKLSTKGMRQVGVISFGGGLNARYFIEESKSRGFLVLIKAGYAEVWKSE